MIKRTIHRRDAEHAEIPQRLNGHATSLRYLCVLCASTVMLVFSFQTSAQQLPRAQWGAPEVNVAQGSGKWTIAGKKNTVTLNESDLAMKVQAGNTVWQMVPSSPKDMLVRAKDVDTYVRLANATKKTVTRYDTGYKTGVKIVLNGWKPVRTGALIANGTSALPAIDLTLVLTVALEGKDEELVFDAVAQEHEAVVRQLDWPAALDAREV